METAEWTQTTKLRDLKNRMHGHELHDLKHNEYSNRIVPNIKPHSCTYKLHDLKHEYSELSQTLNHIHVRIDTHRLVQHTLQVVEMAWTDDSTLAMFFYMRYQ